MSKKRGGSEIENISKKDGEKIPKLGKKYKPLSIV